ncbi:MAG: bifunctional pyr operon transcriptional regulator/uracil phosphoribosyltransferase PyrR [Candidatus Hydrothermota bacterium]|nr:MAG: bifunctional pyr operon transcriptional regulator/uracil phosphoribosyltransferase PyrR [Candidatus Hydrothermae bacterium]
MADLKLDYVLMDEVDMDLVLKRIAHEIVERERNLENLLLIGVLRRGEPLAHKLAQSLTQSGEVEVPVGTADVKFYTDDLRLVSQSPIVQEVNLPISIDGKVVILVDDVLYTGRTLWALMQRLFEMGNPKAVRICALVDRGHREIPICPDYVGKTITTTDDQVVKVEVSEIDGHDMVKVMRRV